MKILLVITLLLFATHQVSAKTSETEDWYTLNQHYDQAISALVVEQHQRAKDQSLQKFVRIEKFANALAAVSREIQLHLILENADLIKLNIDSSTSLEVIETLLEENLYTLTKPFAREALRYGTSFTTSKTHYYLAKYFFKIGDYAKVTKNLDAIDVVDALSIDQKNHISIMRGVILQRTGKHREALNAYEEVSNDSAMYSYASLNKASALVRQGWWTEAHQQLKNGIEAAKNFKQDELKNRLLLTLGYSQMQQEFYRHARTTFREIEVESRYSDRALLGIAISALNLEDYQGALNVLLYLQENGKHKLSLYESYLLVPIVYKRLAQTENATQKYEEAIAYYETQLLNINSQRRSDGDTNKRDTLSFENENTLPTIILKNLQKLKHYIQQFDTQSTPQQEASLAELLELQNRYLLLIDKLTLEAVDSTKSALKSYQNQAQYGLARIYDDKK